MNIPRYHIESFDLLPQFIALEAPDGEWCKWEDVQAALEQARADFYKRQQEQSDVLMEASGINKLISKEIAEMDRAATKAQRLK